MTQEDKFKYGKLIVELYKQEQEAADKMDFQKSNELLVKLNKLKLINPEFFLTTIRSI